jgi:hypothetical protein
MVHAWQYAENDFSYQLIDAGMSFKGSNERPPSITKSREAFLAATGYCSYKRHSKMFTYHPYLLAHACVMWRIQVMNRWLVG